MAISIMKAVPLPFPSHLSCVS